jgi:hypothetical protein
MVFTTVRYLASFWLSISVALAGCDGAGTGSSGFAILPREVILADVVACVLMEDKAVRMIVV